MARRGEHIYKRKDGRWEGRLFYVDPVTGKRKYRSVYAQSCAKVRMQMDQLVHGEGASMIRVTLQEWLESWLRDYVAPSVRPSTYAAYQRYMMHHVCPALGKFPLHTLHTAQLQIFCNEQARRGHRNGGALSPSTVRQIHCILSMALRQAVKNGLIMNNPCDGVVLPRVQKREMRVLSREEQGRLMQLLRGEHSACAVGIQISLMTGVRVGELCALHWRDVDFRRHSIRVNFTMQRLPAQGGSTCMVLSPPKTNSSCREIPMPHLLEEILLEYRQGLKEASRQPESPLLCNSKGQPLDVRTVQYAFQRWMQRAQLCHANFHALRHTFATRAVELGMDGKTLSELLGHSDPSVTMRRYVHALDDHKQAQIQRMDIFLQQELEKMQRMDNGALQVL